MIKTVVYT